MAGGMMPAGTHNFEGRITVYVLFASLVAASGGLLFGYDIGVIVTTHPGFLNTFFPQVLDQKPGQANSAWCKYDDQLLQFFTSSLFLAGIVGGLLSSFTTARLGRTGTMIIAGVCFIVGSGLCAGAINTAMLLAGRSMLGLGVGCANQAVPLYLSEVAPAKSRGAMNIMFQMATVLGVLAGPLVNYGTQYLSPWGWRLSLGAAAVPGVLVLLGGIFLPETPNSLIQRGHMERGRHVLQCLRGKDVDVEEEYKDIVEASEVSSQMRSNHFTIFKKDHWPQLTWAILIPAFHQLTGMNAINLYSTPLFRTLGFGQSASLFSAVIVGVVNVLATVVSILTVDRMGRRVIFIAGGIIMIIMQVVVASLLAVYFGNGMGSLGSPVAFSLVAVICMYVAGFAWSWGPLGWLVPSEIQPLETRSTGQSITVAVSFLFTFLIGQAFPSMLCRMQYGIFLFFAGWLVIMTIAVIFFLPETKGVPIEDMKNVFIQHWFWSRLFPKEVDVERSETIEDMR